jgi:hypothetical protein
MSTVNTIQEGIKSGADTILQLAESGSAETLREVLRDRCLRSLYYWGKVVAGYTKLTDYLHLPLCNHIQDSAVSIRKRAYLYPRGYYKSSVGKAYGSWSLLPCPELDYTGQRYSDILRFLHDPDGPILYVSESEAVAASKLRDIRFLIESSELVRWLFPEILPSKQDKWSETELTLGGRTRSMDESSLTAYGVGGKITGFHYKKIIYDDIIGEKAAESEAEMEKAWSWFQVAPGLLQDPGTGEELLLGTRWKHGTADIYGRIKKILPAEVEESGRHTGFVFFEKAIVENNELTFPDKYPMELVKELERRLGPYKFGCNYMNNPTLPEGADFKPGWIKEYKIGQDSSGKLNTIFPQDGTPPINIGRLVRMSFWDISAGGASAKAENAIIIAGMDSMRRIFCLSAWSKNCSIGDAGEQWHLKNDRYACWRNHYEKVGAQKIAEDLERERNMRPPGPKGPMCVRCGESHRRIEALGITPVGGKSKEERIRMFAQTAFQEGRVYLYEGMFKLKGQILSFPHGDLVDEFDAFSYLINLLRPPLSDEETLEAEAEEARAMQPAKSRVCSERSYGGYV